MRYPVIENACKIIVEACNEKTSGLYRMPLPKEISKRSVDEMNTIVTGDNETIYLIAKHLVDQSRAAGQPNGIRGGVGSSLIAFLLGITGINPLEPHYHCKNCKHIEFVPGAASGFDLADKPCPHCEKTMIGDGHDIPFETFGGLTGDRQPDIDINFPNEYAAKGKALLETIFPDDLIIKAGFIPKETNQLSAHPGGWLIVPREYADEVQIATIGEDKNIAVTEQDYYQCYEYDYYKQDILGHSALDRLCKLSAETNIPLDSIPMNDPKVYQAFHDGKTFDIHTFSEVCADIETMIKTLKFCKPNCFSDLVKVAGLLEEDNNAPALLESDVATLQEVISARDDIFNLLISKGMERKRALEVMEKVRKGKGCDLPDDIFDGYDLPKWYVESCKTIKYLFPKAHIVSYTKTAVQMMWFKLYHREVFDRVMADAE
jgi:DNA polymerase-3 subunit alpha (Gram-positive type)